MRGQALGVLHGSFELVCGDLTGAQRVFEPPEVNSLLPAMQQALAECLILEQGGKTGVIPPSYALSKRY
jgi:hypothetical protein